MWIIGLSDNSILSAYYSSLYKVWLSKYHKLLTFQSKHKNNMAKLNKMDFHINPTFMWQDYYPSLSHAQRKDGFYLGARSAFIEIGILKYWNESLCVICEMIHRLLVWDTIMFFKINSCPESHTWSLPLLHTKNISEFH